MKWKRGDGCGFLRPSRRCVGGDVYVQRRQFFGDASDITEGMKVELQRPFKNNRDQLRSLHWWWWCGGG